MYLSVSIFLIFYIQVENRTIVQLQSKYKELKKNARQVLSKMKREMAQTGNQKLRSSTQNAMNDDSLMLLRKRMGPSAAGFKSKNCERKNYIQTQHSKFVSLENKNEIKITSFLFFRF